MKRKTMTGLIAIAVIVAVAIFAGCVEDEEVTPTTPTSTPLAPTTTPEAISTEPPITNDLGEKFFDFKKKPDPYFPSADYGETHSYAPGGIPIASSVRTELKNRGGLGEVFVSVVLEESGDVISSNVFFMDKDETVTVEVSVGVAYGSRTFKFTARAASPGDDAQGRQMWLKRADGTVDNGRVQQEKLYGLSGIWGSSSTDVFAVGNHRIILHYDGTTWTEMTRGPEVPLTGVWGSSSDDVFAVGWYGTILHYDGTTWSKMNSGITSSLEDVWGSSSSDVFAIETMSSVWHYNGTRWSRMSASTKNCPIPVFEGVWGSSSDDVFAVGCGGSHLDGIILHYDGTTWTEMNSGTTEWLNGIWGSSSDDVFAVGGEVTILHYDGTTWSKMSSGIENRHFGLFNVWGSSSSDVFAVGGLGTILHYDGTTWTEMNSGTKEALYAVWGSSPDDVFAVGVSRTILHYDGSTWSSMQSP